MNRYLTRYIQLLLCLLLALPAAAQYKSIHRLDVTDGLSQNTINSIYQDERNYIWFGTRNGLNIYNGTHFTTFKNQKDNPASLPSSEVKQITGNLDGQVFIRTGNGAVLRVKVGARAYEQLIRAEATTMCHADGALYVACSHVIWRFPDEGGQEEYYTFEDKRNVVSAMEKVKGKLFIGTTRKGLYSLSDTGLLEHLIPEGYVTNVMEDSFGEIWATFQEGIGLVRFTPEGRFVYRHSDTDPSSLNSDRVQTCCEDLDGNIWIGTYDGLSIFDRKTGTISRYDNPYVSDNSIISLMTDHQGTVWAGTYYLGVWYFNPYDQLYDVFHVANDHRSGLNSEVVGDMVEDVDGSVWIATAGGGLNHYIKSEERFEYYTEEDGLLSDNLKCLYLDKDRRKIWMGTHMGGLSVLDIRTRKIRNYTHQDGKAWTLPSNVVRDIIPYGEELLLAAKGGIVLFDRTSGRCRPFFDNPDYQKVTRYSSQLLMDKQHNLWILHTSNGAFRYDTETGQMNVFQNNKFVPGGISPGRINAISEDSQGRIWFCNNQNGLDMFDYTTGIFRNFDVKSSRLSSNTLYAVAELSPDRLVVTTDNGYSILMIERNSSLNFQNNRSIPLVSANENSLLSASDGTVYIGGMNGMLAFNWAKTALPRKNYEIRPYLLRLDGEPVHVQDGTEVLDTDLSVAEKIVIPPGVSSMSLEYAITDYLPYANDEFYYRLEGFSSIWHRLDESHVVSFTNLNPGKYRLVVESFGEAGEALKSHSLEVVVRTPFYKTTVAYLLYTLLICIVLYLIIGNYNNRIRLQEAVKYEKKHTQEVEELNQYKLRFFTNISHEFRTPLSVIIAQMELMMDKYHDNMSIYIPLNRIYRCCVQLKYLVSELLDFRKQEQGYMKLKVQALDLVGFVHEQYLNFQAYAHQKGIHYKFVKVSDDITVWFDPKQLQKVVNNLIFNAFKHVDQKGKILVSVNRDESHVLIDIVNTGEGIKMDEVDKIFNRFYQIDTKDSVGAGTGIGLALSKGIVELHKGEIKVFSEPGKETTFRVILPLGNAHFSADELVENENHLPQVDQSSLCTAGLDHPTGNVDTTSPDCKNGSILIVEDDASLKDILIQLFEPFYHVCSAADGREGLEKMKEEPVDLVISDIMMPVMDGLEFCREIKTNEVLSHIPVILLTARTDESQKLEGLKYGADDYIVKPFSSRELVSRCNNLINSRRLLKNKFAREEKDDPVDLVVANNTKDLEFVNRAREIVKEHLSESDFRLEDLARELGVSRTKLFTRLRTIQNQTPMEFIVDVHLAEAAQMLKNDLELNISEVSAKAGFSSPKFFRKSFKEKYGMTPLDYRKG